MTQAQNKQEYINQWQDHIQSLGILAFCRDEKLSAEVQKHMTKLKELVVKIAETKNFEEGETK